MRFLNKSEAAIGIHADKKYIFLTCLFLFGLTWILGCSDLIQQLQEPKWLDDACSGLDEKSYVCFVGRTPVPLEGYSPPIQFGGERAKLQCRAEYARWLGLKLESISEEIERTIGDHDGNRQTSVFFEQVVRESFTHQIEAMEYSSPYSYSVAEEGNKKLWHFAVRCSVKTQDSEEVVLKIANATFLQQLMNNPAALEIAKEVIKKGLHVP